MKPAVAIFILAVLTPLVGLGADNTSSCITCHAKRHGAVARPALVYTEDVHFQVGITCVDCHGGDPSDPTRDSMSPAKGFHDAPERKQVPAFCARCHSDPAYMRRYNPRLRTDQYSQYLTSVHGRRLKAGDKNVAMCVDCHSVHDTLKVSDPRSPVHPTNVPKTCSRCHADSAIMNGYHIPADQFELYEKSMHAQALAKGDTSAPTCATCHGNHGAMPPGVNTVADVCGTCHASNQQLFDHSPHREAFARRKVPGCVECHSNHAIVQPVDAWEGVGPRSVCVKCHASGDPGYRSALAAWRDLTYLDSAEERAREALGNAERSGMEVSNGLMTLTEAHAQLIKARVDVHSLSEALVRKDTAEGMQLAQKALEAGAAALRERDFRRKGLGVSLIFILLAMAGLYLKIREMESRSVAPADPVAKR